MCTGSGVAVSSNGEAAPIEVKKVSVFHLAFVCFFLTCGGPYGLEVSVGSGGALVTLISFILLPFLYGLPQAFMTAELSSMMAENGGYVIWVHRAFGDFAAFVNAYNNLLCNFADNSLYPVLAVAYLQSYNLTWWQQMYIKVAIVVVSAGLNLRGLELVGSVSAVLTMLIILPFAILFFMGIPNMAPSQWIQIDKDNLHLGVFVGSVLWFYSGWDSVGTVAGEVADVHKTYPRAVLLCVLMQAACYICPILWGLTFHASQDTWQNGQFEVWATQVSPILGIAVVFSAVVGNFGTYLAETTVTSRVLWAMGHGDDKGERQAPKIFGCLWRRYNTPAVAIIFQTILTCFLMVFQFGLLVQAVTLLKSIALVFEFCAFLYLRIKEKNTPRPYVVPGGWFGAMVVFVPNVLISIGTFFVSQWEPIVVTVGLNVIVICAYCLYLLQQRYTRVPPSFSKDERTSLLSTNNPSLDAEGVRPGEPVYYFKNDEKDVNYQDEDEPERDLEKQYFSTPALKEAAEGFTSMNDPPRSTSTSDLAHRSLPLTPRRTRANLMLR